MPTTIEERLTDFVDRRQTEAGSGQVVTSQAHGGLERRQFSSSRSQTRPEVAELAEAVDQYKLRHRRRFITYEELFDVMSSLGYHK